MARQADRLAAQTLADPRWAAVLARDAQADGSFYYAVSSTGVYCRPSCAARTPRPQNVRFFTTTAQAEQAGFRPCRRCKPDQPALAQQQAVLVAELCRHIEQVAQPPTLAELAQRCGLSRFHLLRVFKAVTGMTPLAYARQRRAARLREQLDSEVRVTDAIYAAGYASSGRFYEESTQVLGMTASRYRAGGEAERIRFGVGECSLGAILVAASARGVCAILLGDDAEALTRELQQRFSKAELIGGDAAFEQWMAQVIGFVEAPRRGLELPLDVRGTAFQRRVWQALQAIPVGSTLSYSELAERIGAPSAARAVAGACAANALAVAIPCHRVVRQDGSLSGYRWGIERKRRLQQREAES